MPAPNGPWSCRANEPNVLVACAGVATVIKVKDVGHHGPASARVWLAFSPVVNIGGVFV
jgi:hypothetical protein